LVRLTKRSTVWATMLSVPKMGISETECNLTCPMIANEGALFYRNSGPLLGVGLCTRNWIQHIFRDYGRRNYIENYAIFLRLLKYLATSIDVK